MNKRIRVLIAKPGLDGHDRGAKVLAHAMREEGFEVIYTGIKQTPRQVVATALQEDVDVICLSILSGAHMHLIPEILRLLKKEKLDDRLLLAGGIIPDDDQTVLRKQGIEIIYGPGTKLKDPIEYIKKRLS